MYARGNRGIIIRLGPTLEEKLINEERVLRLNYAPAARNLSVILIKISIWTLDTELYNAGIFGRCSE